MTSFGSAYYGSRSTKRAMRLLRIASLLAVFTLVLMTKSEDESFQTYIRRLCELDTTFNEGVDDDDYTVWTESFETATIDYYEQAQEPPSELAIERNQDIAFILPMLECPELPAGMKAGVPEDAPDNDFMYDEISLLSYSVCEECGVVTLNGVTYNTTLYAIIPGDAIECMGPNGETYDRVKVLQELGFFVDIQGAPVLSKDIEDDYLRNNVESDVGLKDLLKLKAYNYTTHPMAVVIDYSTFVMKPLHNVFSTLEASTKPAAVTMDYSPYNTNADANNRGIDTGLLFIKPNEAVYNDILNTYRETTYDPVTGWGGSGIGGFPGAMGTSGILTYYYSQQEPEDQPIILDKCLYNNDNEVHLNSQGQCRDRASSEQQNCANCQLTLPEDIVAGRMHNNVDTTELEVTGVCEKAYNCPAEDTSSICEHMYTEWFAKRETYETVHFHKGGRRAEKNEGKSPKPGRDKGFCHGTGKESYQKLLPDKTTDPTPKKKEPEPMDTSFSCPNTCEPGQYLTPDCVCSSDECDACPEGTRCQPKKDGQPPMCIDCNCGFCDYDGNACCSMNARGNNCKSNTNKKECIMQNAYFPGWAGTGNVCSGVEVSATATPNGCGCQPSEATPCTYDRSLQNEEDKCFVTRAHELLTSSHDSMSPQAVTVASNCRDCLVASCGEHCPGAGGVGQADVHAMQKCLGQTIGKKKDACRQACAASCNHANLS
eukprot:CAMPEP_0195292678 /NCGR_PEP_ID=MMETSP0707-20130614/10488_1 /TAXON_ID=33640 /ORGANISM="Asterionellopsis glacialis, Strain CCMP134" /LENGTH=712 /DNA_ID=CAMNT_0040353203 /DNA_START=27 /DNA_END=2165 /DNA_ORIENTATION=-